MDNERLSAFLREIAQRPDFAAVPVPGVMMRSPAGNTPLHIAAIHGDTLVVRALLDAGADPNAAGEQGDTPLHGALGQKHLQVARMLIAAGGSLDASNRDGVTARDMTQAVSLWETEN